MMRQVLFFLLACLLCAQVDGSVSKHLCLAHEERPSSRGKGLFRVRGGFANNAGKIATTSVVPGSELGVTGDSNKMSDTVRKLLPLYVVFALDCIAVGLVSPILPFFTNSLGATVSQHTEIISIQSVAQMVGCLIFGSLSDRLGRLPILLACTSASAVSFYAMSRSTSPKHVLFSRLISGAFGGLLPVVQSCVTDVTSERDRPAYLGRISATFGLGFVVGPMLSGLLSSATDLSARMKIRVAGVLPAIAFLITAVFMRETLQRPPQIEEKDNSNKDAPKIEDRDNSATVTESPSTTDNTEVSTEQVVAPVSNSSTKLLVLNGFLLMFAFGTETVYAMLMKDSFQYGEKALSLLFACSGAAIGILQTFFAKPIINCLGKHKTLALGELLLSAGMIGIALIRKKVLHFIVFGIHIMAHSLSDTSLVSLLVHYSTPSTRGRDLSLNAAVQSCARIISPLLAGKIYEMQKNSPEMFPMLPIGALPFIVGAFFPVCAGGIAIYLEGVRLSIKRQAKSLEPVTN